MKEIDYIKKATALADGFSIAVGGVYRTPCGNPVEYQVLKDALAAQLVRQVDALEFEIEFDSPEVHGQSSVRLWHPSKGYVTDSVEGPDRTMNTIRAIVDSKVLE